MKNILILIAVLGLAIGASAQTLKEQNLIAPGVNTIVVADNTTTNLPSTVYRDANLWANVDGSSPNVALLVSVLGTNAAATNTFTVTLRPVHNVSTSLTANNVTDSTRSFAVALAATGTTRATMATNLPAGLLQGVKGLRLVSVATSDEAGNSAGITATAKLVGFAP
jgi:hypothetical protein